jgi:hypothetical protein
MKGKNPQKISEEAETSGKHKKRAKTVELAESADSLLLFLIRSLIKQLFNFWWNYAGLRFSLGDFIVP